MYRAFYNLNGRPFQLTPDLKFLFPSKSHKRAMSYLHYGLEQSEGFVVITGHIGTGKTMLIQKLLDDLKDQEIATARIAAANLDAENVVSTVAAALRQPYEGKSKIAILNSLEKSLLHARDYLRGVLLIVDEAQTLTTEALEELRILSNLESNGRALLQVFLVGQSDLRDLLRLPNMEQLRQRIVASYHLEPLTEDETKRYIGFRLVAVGWTGDPSFSPSVYRVIHEWTDGIPRKINILMDRVLVYGFLEELRAFDENDVVKVMDEMSEELAGDLVTPLVAAPAVPPVQTVPPVQAVPPVPSPAASVAPAAAAASAGNGNRDALEKRLHALEARLEQLAHGGRGKARDA